MEDPDQAELEIFSVAFFRHEDNYNFYVTGTMPEFILLSAHGETGYPIKDIPMTRIPVSRRWISSWSIPRIWQQITRRLIMKLIYLLIFYFIFFTANASNAVQYDYIFLHDGLSVNIGQNTEATSWSEKLLNSCSPQPSSSEKEPTEDFDLSFGLPSGFESPPVFNLRTVNDTNFLIIGHCLYYKTPEMNEFEYYKLDKETSCAIGYNDGSLLILHNDTTGSQIVRYEPQITSSERLGKSVLFSTTETLTSFDFDTTGEFIAYNKTSEKDGFETIIQSIINNKLVYRGRFNKTMFLKDAVAFYDERQASWTIASFPKFDIINIIRTKNLYSSPNRRYVFNPDRFVVYEAPHLGVTDEKGSLRPVRYLERIESAEFVSHGDQDVSLILHTWYPEVNETETGVGRKDKIWQFDKKNPDGKVLWERSIDSINGLEKFGLRRYNFFLVCRQK